MTTLTRRQFIAGSAIFVNGIPISLAAQTPAATPWATPVAATSHWWHGSLFYEVFVRSFLDSDGDGIGDFAGLESNLDYLQAMGVQALWLMPIMPSPSYHGYDVTDYETVNPEFGSEDDFHSLVTALHDRDMRIIIDYPINHTSVEHPWFVEAASDPASPKRDWYIFEDEDPGYLGPWGETVWHPNPHGDGYYYGIFDSSMPDLNYLNPEVDEEIHRITTFWLTDMNVDGFRMDAIKHVIEEGQIQEGTPETIAWIETFAGWVRDTNPEAFTVGEVMGSGTDGLLPYYPNTLDAYFHFALAQELVNGANFGNSRKIINFVNGALERLPDQRWGTFLSNHDQERIGSALEGDTGKLAVAAMMLLTLPGIPFMYYGEEIGMTGTKPDPTIRTPMQWSSDANAGFTTGSPYTSLQPDWPTINVELQEDDPASLLSTYRTWGTLRAEHDAIRIGDFVSLDTDQRSLMAFTRSVESETVLVVINMGKEASESVTLETGFSATSASNLMTGETGPADSTFDVPSLPAHSGVMWMLES